jgi:hypothetical protein
MVSTTTATNSNAFVNIQTDLQTSFWSTQNVMTRVISLRVSLARVLWAYDSGQAIGLRGQTR